MKYFCVLCPRISSSSSCSPPRGIYTRKNRPKVKKSMKPSRNPFLFVCLYLMHYTLRSLNMIHKAGPVHTQHFRPISRAAFSAG